MESLNQTFTNGLSADRLRKILEISFLESGEAMAVLSDFKDGHTFEITFANHQFCELTGYTHDALIGKQLTHLTGPGTSFHSLTQLADHQEEKTPLSTELLIYKNGREPFTASLDLIPVPTVETGFEFVVKLKDVSVLRRSLDELEDTRKQYNEILSRLPAGIFILSKDALIFANETFLDYTGHDVNKSYHNCDCELKAIRNGCLQLYNGQLDRMQFKFNGTQKKNEGRIFFVSASRSIIRDELRIVGTLEDITSREEMTDRIRKFTQAIEQSSASVVITNLDGSILYANPAFSRISGYALEEVIGQNPRVLKTEYTRPGTHQELWECLAEKKSWKGIFCNRKKTGELYWEQATISPVMNDEGEVINYVAVKEDITERMKLEEEKERLIEELTVKIEDLHQFSYIASHNLRSPVTNLMGILDLLEPDAVQGETNQLLIQSLRKSVGRLNETLNDLINSLVSSSPEVHPWNVLQLQDLFDKTTQNLKTMIKNTGATVSCDFSHLPEWKFNKIYIESVFQNLISNALKYHRPGVTPEISVTSAAEEGKLILRFKDNGLGMDLKKIGDRLFGMYQRFHRDYDSKGLGLFLVKAHVRAMSGEIRVDSKVNEGTEFILTFNPTE